jgi:ABC-type transport system involved in multi-copper enzyme maturation permease subunit
MTIYSFWLLIFQITFIAVFFSKSVADQIEKREILILLSHPVKRTSILLAKFLTNITVILLIFAAITFTKGLLMGLGPFHPAHYIALLTILIQTLFFSAISLACSTFSKSAWASIILPTITFFALAFSFPQKSTYNYLSPTMGMQIIFQYLTALFIPNQGLSLNLPTEQEFQGAIFFPIATSIFLLLISFAYFRKMEVD